MEKIRMARVKDGSVLRIREATVRKGPGGGRTILDRVTLEIPQGEHTAILGPNGSGKSTLIKLITQEYRPLAHSDGEPAVEIFGRSRWDVFELRSLLGIISSDLQHNFMDADHGTLVGLDVVVSGFFATRGVQRRHHVTDDLRERGCAALALMHATHLAEKPMHEMSTGEARRVLIARALVHNPPALLLDEPTTGLDVVARHRFMETVRELARMGKTIIIVTHHLYEVIPEIKRVVLLRDGQVYRDGDKDTVLTPANLSAVFGAAVQVELADAEYYRMRVVPEPL